MNQYLSYIVLIICFLAFYIVNSFTQLPSFFTSYFEDLIALPIFLKSALFGVQHLSKSCRSYSIPHRHIAIVTMGVALYFEAILPTFNPTYTADILDVGCYCLGALFYARFLNQPLKYKNTATLIIKPH